MHVCRVLMFFLAACGCQSPPPSVDAAAGGGARPGTGPGAVPVGVIIEVEVDDGLDSARRAQAEAARDFANADAPRPKPAATTGEERRAELGELQRRIELRRGMERAARRAESEAARDFVSAAGRGDLDAVRRMLDGDPKLVHATNDTRETALFKAAWMGRTEVAKLLVERGADVNGGSGQGTVNPGRVTNLPLAMAIAKKHDDIVELLLAKGADVNGGSDFKPLNAAVARQDKALVKRLLALGAELDGRSGHWSRTALQGTASVGRTEMAGFLLDLGADINAKDREGRTALHLVTEEGHAEVVDLLLARGAEVDAKTEMGATPLFAAAAGGRSDLVKRLLDAGADPNAVGRAGGTPVMSAVTRREERGGPTPEAKIRVLELLAAAGADVKARAEDGSNALHGAVPPASVEVARWLVDHGVDVNARSRDGYTPLKLTRHWSNARELREFLKSRGARE